MSTPKSLFILLIILSLGLLTACGAQPEAEPEPAPEPTEAASEESTPEPTEEAEEEATEEAEEEPEEAESGAYAGETIEIIVPFGEGGGSDTWARAIAPFLQKYLGEDVTVQPVNVPGASGVQGANEFALSREPDGLSMLVSSGSNVFPFLLGEEAVQYDFNDYFNVMGSPVGGVVYVSSELGIEDVAGLCESTEALIYGGVSPTGLDLVPLLTFEMLGLETIPILGYDGKGAARVAFEQGETTLDYQTSPAYLSNVQPLVDEGIAVPLFTFGILDSAGEVIRDPVFPDLPSFAEAYESCQGEAPDELEWDTYKAVLVAGFAAQKNMWVHGDAPQERIDDLVAAAQKTINDPEFKELAADLIGDYEFSVGDEAQATFAAASQLEGDSLDWLKNFLSEKYDVDLQ